MTKDIQRLFLIVALIFSIFISCKRQEIAKVRRRSGAKNNNIGQKGQVNSLTISYQFKKRNTTEGKKLFLRAGNTLNYDFENSPGFTTPAPRTMKYCVKLGSTLRARHKSCFLRPDTGPCRADIVQWYYDVRKSTCFRFFYGGCQGNGNKFDTRKECTNYCFLNDTMGAIHKLPYYCNMQFDFGTCFGHYYRWYWDKSVKTCKRRVYSGCGGNQNNFQSRHECFFSCAVLEPNNTFYIKPQSDKTTCFPIAE